MVQVTSLSTREETSLGAVYIFILISLIYKCVCSLDLSSETVVTSAWFPYYKQNKIFNVCSFYICIKSWFYLFLKIIFQQRLKPVGPQMTPSKKCLGMEPVNNYKGFRASKGQSLRSIFPRLIKPSSKWIIEVALIWQSILLYGE